MQILLLLLCIYELMGVNFLFIKTNIQDVYPNLNLMFDRIKMLYV